MCEKRTNTGPVPLVRPATQSTSPIESISTVLLLVAWGSTPSNRFGGDSLASLGGGVTLYSPLPWCGRGSKFDDRHVELVATAKHLDTTNRAMEWSLLCPVY